MTSALLIIVQDLVPRLRVHMAFAPNLGGLVALPMALGLLVATRAHALAARFQPWLARPLFSVTMYQ